MKIDDYEIILENLKWGANQLKVYYKGEEYRVTRMKVTRYSIKPLDTVTLEISTRNSTLKEDNWYKLFEDLSWYPSNSVDFIMED